MHITHLALGVDTLSSVMLDVVDHPTLVAGTTKQRKLDVLWENYREWCEGGRLLFMI
jgi:predicted RNase H-like nuclease